MAEILQNFEQVAVRFDSVVLAVPGLLCLAVGLIIWLSGLRYAPIVAGATVAVIAGTGGYYLLCLQPMPSVFLAALGALVGALLARITLAIAITAIGIVITLLVLGSGGVKDDGSVPPYEYHNQESITTSEAGKVTKQYWIALWNEARIICSKLSLPGWMFVIAVGAAIGIAAVRFNYSASALFCSILGTSLSFAGMVLLLIYKGSGPITRITEKSLFYACVFAAMVVFGALVQLVLLPVRGAGTDGKNDVTEGEQATNGTPSKTRKRYIQMDL